MSQAVTFAGGPLDGQVFLVPDAPSVLYAGRTVGSDGVVFVPSRDEAPPALRAGVYRKAPAPHAGARGLYRFEE